MKVHFILVISTTEEKLPDCDGKFVVPSHIMHNLTSYYKHSFRQGKL
ncbi:MAG: hypothetical protein QNJ51_19095 [Calothrix sp. MO_167.B12]|nr:hypothetical protein [Calothrix sp. MO_167.B12]